MAILMNQNLWLILLCKLDVLERKKKKTGMRRLFYTLAWKRQGQQVILIAAWGIKLWHRKRICCSELKLGKLKSSALIYFFELEGGSDVFVVLFWLLLGGLIIHASCSESLNVHCSVLAACVLFKLISHISSVK